MQVANREVRYFLDGEPYYPEDTTSINFHLWFIRERSIDSRKARVYQEDVDGVFHRVGAVRAPNDVDAEVTRLRSAGVAFRDTVIAPQPALTSPCDFQLSACPFERLLRSLIRDALSRAGTQQESTMKMERIAEIQLVKDAVQPMLKVTVPRGTTLVDTLRLQPTISEILGKLRGCLPCNSGIPIWFHEREEIENIVRIDLSNMQRIG